MTVIDTTPQPRPDRERPDAGGGPHGLEVSFEFFPPTEPAMATLLWESVRKLATLAPRFVSVTYGADGSTRDRTFDIVQRLRSTTTLDVAPHLTSVGASRTYVQELAHRYWEQGVRRLVALRGDAPAAGSAPTSPVDAYRDGAELVAGLRAVAPFDISVAAYPEVHPEAASAAADLAHLKCKIEAGAARALTQFFFDNDAYLRFRDRCAAAGIDAPIVPGILPVLNFAQVRRFARRCQASIPAWLERRFEGLDDDVETRRLLAAAVAVEQVEALYREGVREFHFYTLNRADLSYAICRALGVRPPRAEAAA